MLFYPSAKGFWLYPGNELIIQDTGVVPARSKNKWLHPSSVAQWTDAWILALGHWLNCDGVCEPLPSLPSAVQLLVTEQVLSLLEQLEHDSPSCTQMRGMDPGRLEHKRCTRCGDAVVEETSNLLKDISPTLAHRPGLKVCSPSLSLRYQSWLI